mmetsp:Transcript_74906/g.216574  ORF Transcript_74906/g.216574 Transcript_74906/m.216574 type:complete len:340 (-) Transcript_74906:153-1172(-)
MGSSHSVELYPSQESPTEPGQLSVISASLDDLDPPVTAEQFLAEAIELMKRPVDSVTEAIMKSLEVTENGSPDDFVVKLIVDGTKLDAYGYGKGDGTDRVRTWKRVVADRAAMHITTYEYVLDIALGAWESEASDAEVLATLHLQMLSGPTRIESWVLPKEGERLHNDDLAKGLYHWTDAIIGQLHSVAKAKVKAAVGKAIKNVGEDSVVSEPMDEHVDYDSYFDKMVTVVKEKLEKIPEVESETSEGKMVFKVKGKDEEGFLTWTVSYSAESGELTIVNHDPKGQLVSTSFRQLHRSPLVLEAWNISGRGERSAGPSFARLIQQEIIIVIDRANSWFG